MYIIDRFEGDYAVCEDETKATFDIPKTLLPADAKAGDVLIPCSGSPGYEIDHKETARRREAARERLNRLRRN